MDKEAEFLKVATPEVCKRLEKVATKFAKNNWEDLYQDSMLQAWKNFDKFTHGSFFTWAATIIRYTFMNRYRVIKRNREYNNNCDQDLVMEMSARRGVAAEIPSDDLQLALSKLPSNMQEIIWMADWYGLSYAETAELAEIPIGTVMSRLYRARNHLREELVN